MKKNNEPPDGFEPPSNTNYVFALLLSYSGLCIEFQRLKHYMYTNFLLKFNCKDTNFFKYTNNY